MKQIRGEKGNFMGNIFLVLDENIIRGRVWGKEGREKLFGYIYIFLSDKRGMFFLHGLAEPCQNLGYYSMYSMDK